MYLSVEFRPALAKIIFDLAFEKDADIAEPLVSRSIRARGFDQVPARAFGSDDQRVTTFYDSLPELLEKPVISSRATKGTSGISTELASPLEIAAEQAINPECRPINLTRPTPFRALRASVCAAAIASTAAAQAVS